jgi:V8-like Glu-specific endopeptidase
MARNSQDQLIRGTGFLIASDLVLTAAQNVYSKELKANNINILFYPGATG